MGPGLIVGEHCLTRKLNEDMIPYLTTSFLKNITDLPTYEAFSHELEGNKTMGHRPHDAGHIAVSGEMSNFFSSPVGEFDTFSKRSRTYDKFRPTLFPSPRST